MKAALALLTPTFLEGVKAGRAQKENEKIASYLHYGAAARGGQIHSNYLISKAGGTFSLTALPKDLLYASAPIISI